MKTVVFRSHMLLGDAIYACATIGNYARKHPDQDIVVECLDEYPKEVYSWLPGNVRTTFATDTPGERYEFDVTAAMHHAVKHKQGIWRSMGDLLGLESDPVPQLSIPRVQIPEQWKGAFVISPFSRSCTSHSIDLKTGKHMPPNKCFPSSTWMPLVRYLRRRGNVLVVSARQERMEGFSMDESERVAGYPLATVASVFAAARCTISVDNGLARLATLSDAPVITLMPEFLSLEAFAPGQWRPETSFVAQANPTMESSSFTAALKMVMRDNMKVL